MIMERTSVSDFQNAVRDKQADIKSLSLMVLRDEEVMAAALENLTDKNETIRYNSYRAIRSITGSTPAVFYPYWDVFKSQLESDNTYHVLVGIHILADLAMVDTSARFEEMFEQYYQLLNHRSMVVVSHLCLASGRIMLYKPALSGSIEDILLNIDRFIGQQKHKDLIKGAVLEAFTEARPLLHRKKEIREFAMGLLQSSESPKSRKLAKIYLEEPDE
jgi:hypothetical protein